MPGLLLKAPSYASQKGGEKVELQENTTIQFDESFFILFLFLSDMETVFPEKNYTSQGVADFWCSSGRNPRSYARSCWHPCTFILI